MIKQKKAKGKGKLVWRLGTPSPLSRSSHLSPQEFSCGSSIHGKPRLSKIGNLRLRKALARCCRASS